VGKKKLDRTPECQKAFNAIKALLAKDAFLKCPDHNNPFHVCCDASNLQLGAVIMQDDAPIACHSRKLDSAQKNCTVGEKEFLTIESLKERQSMLFGSKKLHVCTDHKNITFSCLNAQRVSRLSHAASKVSMTCLLMHSLVCLFQRGRNKKITSKIQTINARIMIRVQMTPRFTQWPSMMAIFQIALSAFQIKLVLLSCSTWNAELQQLAQREPDEFVRQTLAPNTHPWCCGKELNAPWKTCLPNKSLESAAQWHHLGLGRIGTSRLRDTMQVHFCDRHLKKRR
jgi:hypothetical protein